jgi:carbamoyl-phosphate synthase large subunit
MQTRTSRRRSRKTLLFTGGGGAGTQAMLRLLRGSYDVHFADADSDAKPYPVRSGSWHVIPMASAPEFIGQLRRLCRDLSVDVLVPGVDEELLPISRARDTLPCDVLLPSTGFIETHLDKLASHERLRARGLPTPATESLSDHRKIPFPCIVKPRRGRGSRDVAVVRAEDELRAHLVLCRRPPADFIVQELLEGQEYTVTVVADRGRILRAVVPVKVGIKRGITLRAETHHDDAVMAACTSIHAADPVAGCFNIQLFKTASGDVKPFEINPRISTTACLALAAGVDFVGCYLGGGRRDRRGLAAFRDGLRLRRSWHNQFLA